MIHPTAIIDPKARLAESVEVGPRVLIEGEVEIGENCVIQANAVITGPIKIGPRNIIGYGAILGALPQDLGFRPETVSSVEIGEGNTLREYCTVHRGTQPGSVTRIGSSNFLMVGVHLAHNVQLGDRCIVANNVLFAGHVQVGDNVVVGGGSVFHQFLRIGSYAMIRGLCPFGRDIPPYTRGVAPNSVNGINTVGLRRAGFSLEVRTEIKRAFHLLYQEGLNLTQALESAGKESWSPHAQLFWEFAATSKKRGICRLLPSWRSNIESGDSDD